MSGGEGGRSIDVKRDSGTDAKLQTNLGRTEPAAMSTHLVLHAVSIVQEVCFVCTEVIQCGLRVAGLLQDQEAVLRHLPDLEPAVVAAVVALLGVTAHTGVRYA